MTPDERALRADIDAAPIQSKIGRRWGEPKVVWPFLYIWVRARPTESKVDGYWIRLDCSGYPQEAPTGTFWDMEREIQLDVARRPWGTGEVALAFRIDWPDAAHGGFGSALYMLCDRVGLVTHADWIKEKYPGTIWTPDKGVVYYLDEVTRLLDSTEYTGPRGPVP